MNLFTQGQHGWVSNTVEHQVVDTDIPPHVVHQITGINQLI